MKAAILIVVLIGVLGSARAYSPQQPFDLDRQVGEAENIVRGVLHADGTLTATSALKGNLRVPETYTLEYGASSFPYITGALGDASEPSIIAFLSKPSKEGILRRPYEMIAVSTTKQVYAELLSEMTFGGTAFRAHETWTEKTFLAALDRALIVEAELDVILATPRSAKRVSELVDFLRRNVEWIDRSDENFRKRYHSGYEYFFLQVVQGLLEPTAEEEAIVAQIVRDADSPGDEARMLALIRSTRCSRGLYETVLPFIAPRTPEMVRREAFFALMSIDPFAASGALSRFLNPDDPDLESVLVAVSRRNDERGPRILNPVVIDPLDKLGWQLLLRYRQSKNTEDGARAGSVLRAMRSHFHPAFLTLWFEGWNDQGITQMIANAWTSVSDAKLPPSGPLNPSQSSEWWTKNRAVVQTSYDLSTPKGIRKWLETWHTSEDEVTRWMLLELWRFQVVIPESELIAGCSGANSEAYREFVAELWKRERLSVQARKTLVRENLTMWFEVVPEPDRKYKKARRLRVLGTFAFPLPERVGSFYYKGAISTNSDPQIPAEGSDLEFINRGSETQVFAHQFDAWGTGTAKAVVELVEKDYRVLPPRVLWRLRWELDEHSPEGVPPIPE